MVSVIIVVAVAVDLGGQRAVAVGRYVLWIMLSCRRLSNGHDAVYSKGSKHSITRAPPQLPARDLTPDAGCIVQNPFLMDLVLSDARRLHPTRVGPQSPL